MLAILNLKTELYSLQLIYFLFAMFTLFVGSISDGTFIICRKLVYNHRKPVKREMQFL